GTRTSLYKRGLSFVCGIRNSGGAWSNFRSKPWLLRAGSARRGRLSGAALDPGGALTPRRGAGHAQHSPANHSTYSRNLFAYAPNTITQPLSPHFGTYEYASRCHTCFTSEF
ncbi:jg27459, partial [Pararge aegeria aegeria]